MRVVNDCEILKSLDRIQKFCEEEKIHIFRVLEIPEITVFEFDGNLNEFLELMKLIKPKVLYIFQTTFDDFLSRERIEEDEKFGKYEKYIGKIGRLQLIFNFNGIFHSFVLITEWMNELIEEIESEEEFEKISREEEEIRKRLEEYARKLAQSESFGLFTTKSKRVQLLYRIFPELRDHSRNLAEDIVGLAEIIFEEEIKPEIKKEAEKMLEEGKTEREVAIFLRKRGFKYWEIGEFFGKSDEWARRLFKD